MTSDIDDRTRAFMHALGHPRRRARPRVAPALLDAEHRMIEGVAAWRLGEGPAVLLVHGWEDDHSIWTPLIEELARFRRPVVALDLPAHGFSEGERAPLLLCADRIAKVAAAFGPVDAVVAHSFGCPGSVTAMELHGLAPDRVVLIGTAVHQRGQIDRIVERAGLPPEVAERVYATYEADVGRPVEWFDLRRVAPSMTAQALIVHSYDDESCPASGAQALAECWPGADLMLMDGLGHRLVAQDPEVLQRIVDFVL